MMHIYLKTVCTLLLALCICSQTVAQSAAANSSSHSRAWKEYAYGLQLTLPEGVKQTWPTKRGNASFSGRNCTIYLFIQPHVESQPATSPDSPAPGSVEALADQVWVSLGFAADERVMLKEDKQRIADRPGIRSEFSLTNTKTQQARFVGQALFKIDRFTAACAWIITEETFADEARKLTDEVIAGLYLLPPDQISADRTRLLENGDAFINTFNRELLKMDLPFEQTYRISLSGKEVGGIHYLQDMAPPERGPAMIVRRRGRTVADTGTLDFDEEFSVSLDGKRELWQRRATDTGTVPLNAQNPSDIPDRRPMPGNNNGLIIHSDETGAASGDQLAVSRQSRTKQQNPVWKLPTIAYLSQIDAHLLLRRLPRENKEMGFYSYDTQSGQIKLMIVRVELQLGGRYTATLHRRPESLPEIWTFDRSGKLLSQLLPNGNLITPCDPTDLESIWADFTGF